MKVALVHDYIKEYGGAERVLEALHEIWPEAPVFTTVYLPEFLGPHRERFKNWDIRTSWAQYLPFKAKLISPLRILSPLIFRSFDFSKFDVVIVSATGAYFPNTISQRPKTNDQKPVYLCYCHTPPRYLYGYMTAREWKKNGIVRVVGEVMNHFLRLVDFKGAQNVDYFIANSEEVRSRIKKFYKREAVVIYPPVDIAWGSAGPAARSSQGARASLSFGTERTARLGSPPLASPAGTTPRSYYLAGGRLARAKGIDVIIEAFIKLEKPLKVFGKGFAGYDGKFKVQSSKFKVENIEFLGEVSDGEKLKLMKSAKAYVFASYDEDFGITPVEAMSVGTPVIAYRSGGVQETVIDGKTGVLYNKNTPEELTKAIQKFETLTISPSDCIKQAQKFSKEKFKKEIKNFVISTTYKKEKKD